MLTDQQTETIKATAPALQACGEELARDMYARMFRNNPEVKPYFNPAHQQSGRQQRALASAVCAYAQYVDNPAALSDAVELIANKHVSLGILPEHYPIVGKNLLASIEHVMGDAAIGMVGMDIETAARNKIGILTIVWNNGAMAIERKTMPFAIEEYGSVYQGRNYRDVAKALGGWGVRVEKPDEFIPALKQAIEVTKSGQPAMVECLTKEGFDFSRYP